MYFEKKHYQMRIALGLILAANHLTATFIFNNLMIHCHFKPCRDITIRPEFNKVNAIGKI